MPERIQRKRTKGWRMPEGALYVGRPTGLGNPFVVGATLWDSSVYVADGIVTDRQHAVDLYRAWITGRRGPRTGFGPTGPAPDPTLLCGLDLACWCPLDQPCHADVLLEIANPS